MTYEDQHIKNYVLVFCLKSLEFFVQFLAKNRKLGYTYSEHMFALVVMI